MNLNGHAKRLRDRYPAANAHIRWDATEATWGTIKTPLSDPALKDHAAGRAVVGVYPAVNGVARAGVIDVDLHLDRDPTPDEVAAVEAYAMKKHRALTERGIDAALLRHHRFGSYHIVFFVAPVAADRLGRWLKAFADDAGDIHVDTFPSVEGGGNAVRLPGRHHKRPDSWTEAHNGGTWDAWPTPVEALLHLRDNDPEHFPDLGRAPAGSWTPPAPPAEPAPDDRRRAVEAIAGHWPKVGGRRDAALALAGGLLRTGYPVAWAEEFVRAVAEAAGDDEVERRVFVVADTRRKLEGGGKATGWTRLSELLGERGRPVVSAVMGWLGVPTVTFGDGNVRDSRDTVSVKTPAWNPPAPLPEMPGVPPFPIHLFPAKVADYWLAAAESLGYPVDFVAVPALPLLGAAAGRSIAVELKRTYREPPLLRCGLVAPPGAAKSPSLTFAQGPLPMIAAEWVGEYMQLMKEHRVAKMKYEEEVKDWKKNKCQGDAPVEPDCPAVRQLVYNNFTVESLVRGNHTNPRGVAVCKDELSGLVASLNQYKGGKGDDRQNLLSMWAGAGITYNREKDRLAGVPPLTLPHTFMAVSGMIQPELLADFRGDVGRASASNDGWADRFLLSFPDPPPARGENWLTVSEDLEAGYAGVFRELLGWEMIPVLDGEGNPVAHRPYYVPFDRGAEGVWEEFTARVAAQMNGLDPFDSYRGVLSKSKHHALRLAATMYALRRACGELIDTAPVAADTVRRAVELMGYFESHGRRCLGVGWLDQRTRVARRLLNWLARHPEYLTFTRSDAFIQLKDEKDVRRSEQLDQSFRLLVDLNYLRPLPPAPGAVGRPAEAYAINPAWERNTRTPLPNIPKNPREDPLLRDIRDGVSENSPAARPDPATPGDGFPYEEVL